MCTHKICETYIVKMTVQMNWRYHLLCIHFFIGEVGIVYKALLTRRLKESYSETVAVKTLKGFLQKDLVTEMLKECAKMQELDHPNVLPLRGVCLDGGPAPYIIMPFMTNGSLLSHLKENRKTLVIDPESDNVVSMCSSV